MSMNDEVIAYLRQNNIAFAAGDYSTGQQGDGAEQILTWNTAKLGAQPSPTALAAMGVVIAAQNLLSYNAQALNTKRAAGITVSGLPLPCDPLTSGEFGGLRWIASDNAGVLGWTQSVGPFPNGSFSPPLTSAQIISASKAVGGFVSAALAVGSATAAAITAGTVTTTAQIDAAYAALTTSF